MRHAQHFLFKEKDQAADLIIEFFKQFLPPSPPEVPSEPLIQALPKAVQNHQFNLHLPQLERGGYGSALVEIQF